MQARRVRQLPLVDPDSRVVDVVLLSDLIAQPPETLRAVIMAGGFGTRLRPLTDDLPKPMLPVGGRPLIERIVGQLKESGIEHIVVTTHYKPEAIVDHFGDGTNFGVSMTYVQEDEPLGTGGALGLIPNAGEPLLVINGDILTQVDFRAFLDFHREHGADLTVGVRRYTFNVPYGVVENVGVRVTQINEKPEMSFFVNAGIYVLEPGISDYVRAGVSLNMTDLIQTVIEAGHVVVSFPVLEYWMDVGRTDDYLQAQVDQDNGRWR
jgi:NDP-sugar pyrophosphorylase family protein